MEAVLDMALTTVSSLSESFTSGVALTSEDAGPVDVAAKEKTSASPTLGGPEDAMMQITGSEPPAIDSSQEATTASILTSAQDVQNTGKVDHEGDAGAEGEGGDEGHDDGAGAVVAETAEAEQDGDAREAGGWRQGRDERMTRAM